MKYYFAPMEGATGWIFRNAHHKYYSGMTKYYAPFVSPTKDCTLTPKEKRDLIPEHNENMPLVPQILTCNEEAFIRCARAIAEMGYTEINLNLGCPSGTVVSKGKGSGFLCKPDELDRFLDVIFEEPSLQGKKISIKTRIGKDSVEEFPRLLEIYNQYPIYELTIHPRIQKDFYKNSPHMEQFEYALANSTNPLVYNGDLFSRGDLKQIEALLENCSVNGQIGIGGCEAVMLGRGLLKNPGMLVEDEIDYIKLKAFHDEVYEGYKKLLAPDKNVLYPMKEIWTFMIESFPEAQKPFKKLRKAEKCAVYEAAVREIFASV